MASKEFKTLKQQLVEMAKSHRFMLSESKSILLENLLVEASSVKSPKDVGKFIKSNKKKLKDAEDKLEGKDKSMFKRCVDYVKYAASKGLEFIKDNWLTILELMALIFVGMYATRWFSLLAPDPNGKGAKKLKDAIDSATGSMGDGIDAITGKSTNRRLENVGDSGMMRAVKKLESMSDKVFDAVKDYSRDEKESGALMKKFGEILRNDGKKAVEKIADDPKLVDALAKTDDVENFFT